MCCAIKFLMYIFNVVFWMIGGTLLGLGIWMAVDPDALGSLGASSGMDDEVMAAAVYSMIGIGALLFLVGGFGCCGAGGNSTFLILYITLVSIVMVCEVGVIILVAVFWNSLGEDIRDSMYKDVTQKYGHTDQTALTKSWDSMQTNWKCCGSIDYHDYKNNTVFNNNTTSSDWGVPDSCCLGGKTDYTTCLSEVKDNPPTKQVLFIKGCYEGVGDWIDVNAPVVIGVICGFILLQIVGLGTACYTKSRKSKD